MTSSKKFANSDINDWISKKKKMKDKTLNFFEKLSQKFEKINNVGACLLLILLGVAYFVEKYQEEEKAEGIVEVESFSGVGRVDTIHTITGLLENVAKDFNAGGDNKKNHLSYLRILNAASKQGITTDEVAEAWRKKFQERGEMTPRLPSTFYLEFLEEKLKGERGLFSN